jgi:hypothetical protein|tara:strand:- start:53 stop:286 length:234 start_codon:yes stop_codon:yes gene_type:complete
MYIFLVYNDNQRKNLAAWYKFSYLKDIIDFTNNLFRYSDVAEKERIYNTYKTHFRVVEVSAIENYKYFSNNKLITNN